MQKTKYSIVVPVYNRPDEIDELLESLTHQCYKNFEVIIVEDGSSEPCDSVVKKYEGRLSIQYYKKENTGPGITRNYGAERSEGDFIIFFDSDCIIPSDYFNEVELEINARPVDAFGGPDRAHESFSPIQKAINYSMTSFLTTGGIRGGRERMDKFYPRSFNMGISRQVFEDTKGFSTLRFGEDIDFSLRIIKSGFSTRLFPMAWVYHKRRTDFKKFFRQVYNSGIARINLNILHPGTLKLVHLLPSAFVVSMLIFGLCVLICKYSILVPLAYSLMVFINAWTITKKVNVAFLSIGAAWVQLFGYGLGFLHAVWRRVILKGSIFNAFEKNFYK